MFSVSIIKMFSTLSLSLAIKNKVKNIPATSNVAFRLRANPAWFLAKHQYVPWSESLRPWVTLRKNSDPVGNRTRCDSPAVVTNSLSLYHSILGSGIPSALQFNVVGSWRGTTVSAGCSVILGTRYWLGCCVPRKRH